MNNRPGNRISSNPVLVGAITTIIVIVGVFLAYNANTGLPFVPTYEIKAKLPSAGALVDNNEVRVAGVRVGTVTDIHAEQRENGSSYAEMTLKLDESVKPVPEDSTVVVRSRSAVGLKYLLLVPGKSEDGVDEGGSLPISAARPEPVELDQFFNMYQEPVRKAIQRNFTEVGGFLAGRGPDINLVLGELPPLLDKLAPVGRNLASSETDLRGFIRGLSQAAAEVAPVAQEQADMFVALDTTFNALASVARPYIAESIIESGPTQEVTIRESPRIRPFLAASAEFLRAFRPGAEALARSAPTINESLTVGIPTLRSSPRLNNQLAPTARTLRAFAENPGVNTGIETLTSTNQILKPALAQITPAQTTCNYLGLLLRNGESLTSTGNATGKFARAISIMLPVYPNGEGVPSNGPASGAAMPQSVIENVGEPANPDDPSSPKQIRQIDEFRLNNYVHFNPYPNTASPGQDPIECEAGNEEYIVGQTVIGHAPNNSGTVTEDQGTEDQGSENEDGGSGSEERDG